MSVERLLADAFSSVRPQRRLNLAHLPENPMPKITLDPDTGVRNGQLVHALVADLPKQLVISSYLSSSVELACEFEMREHWRGTEERLPISTPIADIIGKAAMEALLGEGIDPFAIGKDEDDPFSLDTLVLETTSARYALSAWMIGRGLQRCLQMGTEDIIGRVSRLSSRGSVNIIRVPQGLGSGLDEAFSETCFSRPFSLFQKAICNAVDGVVAADRVPSIQRYGGGDDGNAKRQVGPSIKRGQENDETDAHYIRRMMTDRIMKDLGHGQSVICLVSDDFELPERVCSIASSEIRLTPVGREDIIALLQLTHSVTGRVAVDALMERLPKDEDLADLPMAVLVAAFSRPTTLQVADFLSVQVGLTETEKSQSSPGLDAAASEPDEAWPRLEDLRGQPAASRELGRLAEDIEDWRAGRARWSDIETSVLFHGPPGTGKSMAATALANELRVPLIDASMGKCQAQGSLSHTLKAFEAAVNEAREKTPSVLLMDELDSLMDRNIPDDNGYMRLLVNATLESLTRIQSYEGVILIGTTNNLDDIDPAIRRSGRFDVKIPMQLPDLSGLTSIVTHGLKGNIEDGAETTEAFSRALRQMVGLSGADAGAIVRRARGEARRRSRRDGSKPSVSGADLLRSIHGHVPVKSPDLEWEIAIHEAGHVVAGVLSGLGYPRGVAILPNGGLTDWSMPPSPDEDRLKAHIVTSLAGGAAEQALLGRRSTGSGLGPESDLAMATRLALRTHRQFGFDTNSLAWEPVNPDGEMLNKTDRKRVDMVLADAANSALQIVEKYRPLVTHVAEALLEAREIDQQSLRKLFENFQDEGLQSVLRSTYAKNRSEGEHYDRSDSQDPPNRRLTLASFVRQAQSTFWSRLQ